MVRTVLGLTSPSSREKQEQIHLLVCPGTIYLECTIITTNIAASLHFNLLIKMGRRLLFFPIHHFFLLFAIAIFSEAATTAATQNKDALVSPEDDEPVAATRSKIHQNVLSVGAASKARRAAISPVRRGDSSPVDGSHRMQNYSLSRQVNYLSKNVDMQSSFETLLRLEEEHQQQIKASLKPPPRISPLFVSVLGSSLLFSISALLWDPSSSRSLWKTVLGKKVETILAVIWLPWCWYHPGRFALVDLFLFLQFVRQPAVLPYLKRAVVPILLKTLKTMLLTEMWTRTWKWVFFQVEQTRLAIQIGLDQGEGENDRESWMEGHLVWPTTEPPSWLVEVHAALVGGVRRGIKSAFKKSVQETVGSAFKIWRTVLEEQILIAVEWHE